MSNDITMAYLAARSGDFNALEEMRDRVDPGIQMLPTRPGSGKTFTLLEVAMYAGFGIHEAKGPADIEATDSTACWLLNRGLELDDQDILTRQLFDGTTSPMQRSLGMLCPRTMLLLMEQGIVADVTAKCDDGRSIVGHLVAQQDVPDRQARVDAIYKLAEDFDRVCAARAAIDEIQRNLEPAP